VTNNLSFIERIRYQLSSTVDFVPDRRYRKIICDGNNRFVVKIFPLNFDAAKLTIVSGRSGSEADEAEGLFTAISGRSTHLPA
jgi:hypothetical protein